MSILMMINVHAMHYKVKIKEPKEKGVVICSLINYFLSGLFELN